MIDELFDYRESPVIPAKPNPNRVEAGTPILDEARASGGNIEVLAENIIHERDKFDGMVETKLVFNVEPMSKQGDRSRVVIPKDGRKPFVHHFQPTEIEAYAKHIRWLVIHQLPVSFKIYDECVHVLQFEVRYLPLKSWTKKMLAELDAGKIIYKTSAPDLDNLQKLNFDSIAGIVFTNDAKIVTMSNVSKIYSRSQGLTIRLIGR